ncbi:MAG: transporter [Chloroflexales bacterium]|nr:transporter [Chloroflexales bacterium]
MVTILLDNPLLLLFVVSALGYLLGRVAIGGSSLGVAAVLFVGLAFGALDPNLKLPEIVYQLGLIVFVYMVGLSSGRQFFASFRRKGLRDNLFVAGMLVFAAALAALAGALLGLESALVAGLFSGSMTNTAALAGVLEYIKGAAPAATLDQALAAPVVAFSITYPMGVVGMLLAITVVRYVWKIDYAREAERARDSATTNRRMHNRTIVVTRPEVTGVAIQELIATQRWDVVFGRLQRAGQLTLSDNQTRLAVGDLVSVIGWYEDLDRVTALLGAPSDEQLDLDRSAFDYRRVFVSNPRLAGQRLRDLNLAQQFGAIVTRVRRGDIELLGHDDTVLELGDRVRVVARREHMDAVSAFFGDSYRAVSEVDILTFNLGLALGLLLGLIPLPLLGGIALRLGFAGGPLVVALVLGALERTGPLVWNLPYSANLTLRQIGLILFLAGVGTRAGYAFVATLAQGGGVALFLAGTAITLLVALLALWIGYRLLKIPMGLLLGMLAGLQTQPAVLGFALEQTGDELPNVGYAAVYPVALITKILLAQILLALLA